MLHKNIPAGEVHVVANWIVADATARNALTPAAADVGKVCWQTDDDSFWALKSDSPLAWARIGGSASTLNGLTDVALTSPSAGQVLKFNGEAWVNDAESSGNSGVAAAATFASRFLLMGA